MRPTLALALALFSISIVLPRAASAAVVTGQTRVLHYHCGLVELNSRRIPYTGKLELQVHPDGIVGGSYRSDSVRPDPFYGQIESVIGGVTGNSIHFSIGARGVISVKGEFKGPHNDEIVGTAQINGKLYEFYARRVK